MIINRRRLLHTWTYQCEKKHLEWFFALINPVLHFILTMRSFKGKVLKYKFSIKVTGSCFQHKSGLQPETWSPLDPAEARGSEWCCKVKIISARFTRSELTAHESFTSRTSRGLMMMKNTVNWAEQQLMKPAEIMNMFVAPLKWWSEAQTLLIHTEGNRVRKLERRTSLLQWFHGVVVITSALHAEGPGFKPQWNHFYG